MPKHSDAKAVSRIIDANINRAKEGLRVCEEMARFLLDERSLTNGFKSIRHEIEAVVRTLPIKFSERLEARDSIRDVGFGVYGKELVRGSLSDVFYANIQRVKESIRVLEEFAKLTDKRSAVKFKNIRYKVYSIEKKAGRLIK